MFPQEHLQVHQTPLRVSLCCFFALHKTSSSPNVLPFKSYETALILFSVPMQPQLCEPPYIRLRSKTYLTVPHSQRHSHFRSIRFALFLKVIQSPITVHLPKGWLIRFLLSIILTLIYFFYISD